MKRLFNTPEEVKGACEMITGQYHDNVKDIDEDKCLLIKVIDSGDRFKVVISWVIEETENDCICTDDFFFLLKSQDHRKLEKYMVGSLDLATEFKVVKAHSPINI